MTFPRGLALAQWLQALGSTNTLGQVEIGTLRHDFLGVVAVQSFGSLIPEEDLAIETAGDDGVFGR